MTDAKVMAIVLGTAQDGGYPQPGCRLTCCERARSDRSLSRSPVSLGVIGTDGSCHIIEVGRKIGDHIEIWEGTGSLEWPLKSASITHAHLGHSDGLRLLGREAIGIKGVKLHCSESMLSLIHQTPTWNILVEQGVIIPQQWGSLIPFEASPGCGFTITPIPVKHRAELSDNHALLIEGGERSLLFMPDQDSWEETLGESTIREWLTSLGADIALIDGTFWDSSELSGRDMSEIPHPTICESLELLGERSSEDPEISFFHLNHTNPLHDEGSDEYAAVRGMGWGISKPGDTYNLG
ncbi:MAG: hypothetical protein CMB22_03500 [Euryarchaeota archaeon]|nr:hypothetical protein [Euryarchaeota archaeon]|tara:strand:+ start:5298 stop:6182 length:885 start_codon:yes stop_codon:yes gene_type:complete